jgi:hypothetical protein
MACWQYWAVLYHCPHLCLHHMDWQPSPCQYKCYTLKHCCKDFLPLAECITHCSRSIHEPYHNKTLQHADVYFIFQLFLSYNAKWLWMMGLEDVEEGNCNLFWGTSIYLKGHSKAFTLRLGPTTARVWSRHPNIGTVLLLPLLVYISAKMFFTTIVSWVDFCSLWVTNQHEGSYSHKQQNCLFRSCMTEGLAAELHRCQLALVPCAVL